ncbi:MAG: 50S ribosome-binding GTPase [Phycisphaerae bacterium]|nr:50S ribosome-binding GTPase [Phycisphaerae bacterium]
MARASSLEARLAGIADATDSLRIYSAVGDAVSRLRADCDAARFHLLRPSDARPVIVLIGGTGTGKSTLLNRLLDAQLTATSYLRTFTAGPIAATQTTDQWPDGWLGVKTTLLSPEQMPAVGQPDELMLITHDSPLLRHLHLVDTPDLDGDKLIHHGQADRAFRWSDGVVFVVTPEKYQMTELLPYYRLAKRYGITATFVMNKVERAAVVEDYARQLTQRGDATEDALPLFAVPRDDAGFEPPAERSLAALRHRLSQLPSADPATRKTAIARRIEDLLGRLRDQVLSPLKTARDEIDRLVAALTAMETPVAGIDVNPMTEALQRRLQQRSILYLMGPGRVLDRVRQVPGVLARLPRTVVDVLRKAKNPAAAQLAETSAEIDFRSALIDQFTIVQTRIDDVVRQSPLSASWADEAYATSRLPVSLAGTIADEELAALQKWIDVQWNATPRDTAVMKKVLGLIPGGEKIAAFSEAAPYILAIVVAAHHAIFGPVDLMVMGTYGLITWLTEKVSNEVAARARLTNRRIANRFEKLTHQQIVATSAWLQKQASARQSLDALEKQADDLQREAASA